MLRVLIILAMACALLVAGLQLFATGDGVGVAVLTARSEAPVAVPATPVPSRTQFGQTIEVPPENRPPSALGLLHLLGSGTADWAQLHRLGMAPGASLEQRFVALKVLEVCAPVLAGFPDAQLPGAGDELMSRVDTARRQIRARCAPMGQVGAARLRQDWTDLRRAVEGSPLSPQWVAFTRQASDRRVAEVGDRMTALFQRHGPAALHWMGAEFGHYLERSSGALAQRIRTLDPEGRLLCPAVTLAACQASAACGPDGLPQLALCASTGDCGGQGDLGVGAHLAGIDHEHGRAIAAWIIEAIRADGWR